MTHLEFEDFVTATERGGAELGPEPSAHLARCRPCRDEQQAVAALLGTLASGAGVAPAAAVLARAHELFGIRERLAGVGRRIERSLGELVSESGLGLEPALGLRGTTSATRQLLFSTDLLDVDLALTRDDGGGTLRGQALARTGGGPDPARRPVLLRSTAEVQPPQVGATDGGGGFRFERVPVGPCRLVIELDDADLEIEFDA